ncbi:tyrosine-type recombinase/integrase [Bacillus sp. 2205SS5-2]|uniref:tyrosine-type recombinase/integrase n=1 Tax=Bacillus sp. 2205SS5-2 TaxID=3109031 RepID=UPI003004E713
MKGTITKRGNTYSYKEEIGKNSVTGKRMQKTKGGFERKKDAEKALAKLLMELDEHEMLSQVMTELEIHKKKQMHWKNRLGPTYHNSNMVVTTEMGKHQDPRNLLRVMKRICDNAEVKRVRFHDLRHTHASILFSKGIDSVRVATRLGHANPKITFLTLAHLLPNTQDEVAEIFEEELNWTCEQ